MKNSKFICLFCLTLSAWASGAQQKLENRDALILHRAEEALTAVIVHDIFSPPVSSRIYLYANMAAYEAAVPSQTEYKSLSKIIVDFLITPNKNVKVNYGLASVYAFMKTGKKYVFSEAALEDSLTSILKSYKKLPQGVYNSSIELGQSIADNIGKWALKDNYRETRKLARYSFLKEEGKWFPTPPGYMAAVEPYWNKMRTIALDSASEFKPVRPPEFSKEQHTEFYKQAHEMYTTTNTLTPEQRGIAMFWDCNPFYLNTQGHLNFATKKLSPGGHWISIVGIACRKVNFDLMKTVATYLSTSTALYDGFIGCWDEKYRSNLIRPESYINANIDEEWRPLLQTPPFPEYPSGHSVISTAAATVLTDIFGDQFSFDDDTETPYGLPVRSFRSFREAANEAAISRLYGGIHYKAAIENGQTQGELIGRKVLAKMKLTE